MISSREFRIYLGPGHPWSPGYEPVRNILEEDVR
jgi:hypothetical protein